MAKFFPHEQVRSEQAELVKAVEACIQGKKHLIAHAPTGLGKTAATLAPALEYAIENKKTVFFLTAKHTQQIIAIDTAQKIRAKHQLKLRGVNLIGKKWMCLQQGVDAIPSGDFAEFCKQLKENDQCNFYLNLRRSSGALTVQAEAKVQELQQRGPLHSQDLVAEAGAENLCAYYLAEHLAEDAELIVTDYAYLFNPHIREGFLAKIKKPLEQCIVIIDEGHNLPSRVRDVLTTSLSSFSLSKAIKEAEKFTYAELAKATAKIAEVLEAYAKQIGGMGEKLITQQQFINAVTAIRDYDMLQQECLVAGDAIREAQRQSFLGSVGKFLEQWQERDTEEGFARIFSVKEGRREPLLTLSYRCLDPAAVVGEVIAQTHSTILMSGTLNPTAMYREVLGFPVETVEQVFDNPFNEENRLNLIVPETTTKFSQRNEAQFLRIAEITAGVVNEIPGNSIIFFPSYALRDAVYRHFYPLAKKTCMLEQRQMTKPEKVELLEKFKAQASSGAVLLGAVGGNFAEGIDLPGDLLKGVIVVGLPLPTPDLETKQLIEHYEKKFGKGKGWEYGYIYPAFTKCLQSAGRCIRTETDRGVVVFLDARYTWPMYTRCFPQDLNIRVSSQYREMVQAFFEQ